MPFLPSIEERNAHCTGLGHVGKHEGPLQYPLQYLLPVIILSMQPACSLSATFFQMQGLEPWTVCDIVLSTTRYEPRIHSRYCPARRGQVRSSDELVDHMAFGLWTLDLPLLAPPSSLPLSLSAASHGNCASNPHQSSRIASSAWIPHISVITPSRHLIGEWLTGNSADNENHVRRFNPVKGICRRLEIDDIDFDDFKLPTQWETYDNKKRKRCEVLVCRSPVVRMALFTFQFTC